MASHRSTLSTEYSRSETFKRLIVCCDGTGQSSSHGEATVPTNVSRLCRALETSKRFPKDPAKGRDHPIEVQQVILYQTGIGTDAITNISGTMAETFGLGLDAHVLEAYNFFVNNYEEGDEIFLFGFSRGAFTARSIASFICNAGLLKSDHVEYLPVFWKQYQERRETDAGRKAWTDWMAKHKNKIEPKLHPKITIKVLGVWDTVGSLGVPETWVSNTLKYTPLRNWFNDAHGFHDTSLPSEDAYATIESAYQALSLDDHRPSFRPTLLYNPPTSQTSGQGKTSTNHKPTVVRNCWFPGVHTDVGGGYVRAYRDISDLTFLWMIDQIGDTLAFKTTLLIDLQEASLKSNKSFETSEIQQKPWGLSKLNDSMTLTFKAGGSAYRTPGEYQHCQKNHCDKGPNLTETIHPSVRLRMLHKKDPKDKDDIEYRPPALAGFTLEKTSEGYVWVKKLKELNEHGEEKVVRLKEWDMYWRKGTLEPELLDKDAKKVLSSDKKIVPVPPIKTWGETLRHPLVALGF